MSTSTRRHLAFALGLSAVVAMSGFLLNAAPPQEVGSWGVLGTTDPSSARSGAATATLEDDTTLIAGGRMLDGTVTDSVLIYDPTTNASTVVGHLASPRVNAAAARLDDGRVLIVGGEIADLLSADAEIFDPFTGTSDVVANMAVPRTRHAATRLADGKVLIVGGVTLENVTLATAEVFDPETGSILEAGSMATPRAGASATLLIDNRVLVAGGHDGTQDLASAELFYPATQEFFPVDTPLSQARSGHTAVLLPHNGAVLIAGGTVADAPVANAPVATTDLFLPTMFPDPYTWSMGTFGPAEHLTHARNQAVSGPMGDDGYVFVAGGGAAEGDAYAFVTLKTDKDDYAPGEFAHITGSGWEPGEEVTLVFQEDPAVHPDYTLTLTANGEGKFSYEEWAPEQHDFGVRFFLMATGAASQRRAQMTFTDSGSFNYATAAGKTNTVTLAAGATNSTTLGVNVDAPKNNGSFNVSLSFADAPGGSSIGIGGAANQIAVSSVVQAFVTTSSDGDNKNFPVTVTVGASVAPGSYELEATAIESVGSISDGSGWKFTIVVPSAAKTTPTITFGAAPTPTFGGGNFTVSATTTNTDSSALVYSVVSGPCALVSGATFSSSGAGSCVVQASGAETANFNAASNTQAVTIAKANATVTVSGYTGMFDGAAHGATGSVVGVAGDPTAAGSSLTLGASFTNVPGGTANWTFNGAPNYNDQSGSVAIVISKANATVTVSGYTGMFDGAAHGATGGVVGVPLDLPAAGSSLTLGASFTNVPGGTANWTFNGAPNYNDQSGSVAIVISKANATVTVSGYTGMFDGAAHGATGSVVGVALDLPAAGSSLTLGASFTNVPGGTANWTFNGAPNYNDQSGSVAIVISKANATVTVSGYTGMFDGAAHGATGSVVGVAGDPTAAGSSLTLGASFTNVPGGTANWTFNGAPNYNDQSGSVAIVISKANATVTVSGYTGMFDGAAHGATGSVLGVPADPTAVGSSLDLGASFTNVPGGTANWTFNGAPNYNDQSGSVAIVISKANATVTVSGYTGMYDGAAHGATGSVVGVALDLPAAGSSLTLGASFTDVPGGTANWTFTGGTNYNDQSGSVAIVISKANATVTVSGYTGMFDGAAHGATGSVLGVPADPTAVGSSLVLGASFTNVPGGTANWTFNGAPNYNDQAGTAPIVINKANATVTVSGYTGMFDGAAHGATGSVLGVPADPTAVGSSLDLGASFTNVPGGTANWTFNGAPNYNDQAGTASIVINKANATVTVSGYTGMFDGAAHGATGSVLGVPADPTAVGSSLDLGASFTNVPGGTANWTFNGAPNYNDQAGTAPIVINKANATVTVSGYTGMFDGAAHGATGSVVGVPLDLPAAGSSLNLGASFTNVPGGTANWTFNGAPNYNDQSGTVAIVISKANAMVTVSGYTGMYDGAAHGATGSVVGVPLDLPAAGSSLNLGASFTNVPGGTANWTFNGAPNYNDQSGSIAIVISKANATVTVSGYSKMFDGAAHGATGSVVGVPLDLPGAGSSLNLGASFTNVPGGTANWTFTGGANYNNQSGSVAIVIAPRSTTTTLSSSLAPLVTPVKVALKATVASMPEAGLLDPTPVGTVTFTDSIAGVLGTVALSGAVAELPPVTLALGQHVVTATYNPSGVPANFSGSASPTNYAPAAAITGPPTGSINAINVPFNFTGTFTDATAPDAEAAWSFDGTSSIGGTVGGSATLGTVTGSKAFATPGVYGVVLSVNDKVGGIAIVNKIDGLDEMVIAYDANGGFVTGGGWINSPAGAYIADTALVGKANFGFVSKYKKGASIPEGETEFQFHAAGLNFKSTSYQWLVVQGTTKAQYKGVGTINGSGSYQFLVSVVDGSPDKIRVKITNGATVVYDNLVGGGVDDADPTTALGGGSIVIHTK